MYPELYTRNRRTDRTPIGDYAFVHEKHIMCIHIIYVTDTCSCMYKTGVRYFDPPPSKMFSKFSNIFINVKYILKNIKIQFEKQL